MTITYEDIRKYKYRLVTTYSFNAGIRLEDRPTRKVGLNSLKTLQDLCTYDPATDMATIHAGYCWDGPSGPTIDDKRAMKPSLKHDYFYQMIRQGFFSEKLRKHADIVYRRDLFANGYPKWRYWMHYDVLRAFGASSATPGTQTDTVFTAP